MRRARHAARAVVLLALPALLAGALAGCAPVARYRGAVPAPGAILAFQADSATLRARLAESASRRHSLGAIEWPAGSDSLVMIVYGDNRPGYRMVTHAYEFHAVRGLTTRKPVRWLHGLAFLPIFLIEGFVPTLDLPRDVISLFTHRYSGGREDGVRRAIERQPRFDVVVNTGDVVTDGRRGRQWETFVAEHQPLRVARPYLATPGNHEGTHDPLARANWNAAMGEPARPERYWFTVEVPEAGARLVFLDSNVLADPGHLYPADVRRRLAGEQLQWADSVLYGPARVKLMFLHHPLVSAGFHDHDWTSDEIAEEHRRLLLDICRRAGVTAVFAGHEHLYQRLFLRNRDGSGFWHITTGGGGSPLYHVPESDWRYAISLPLPANYQVELPAALMRREYHLCRLALPRSGDGAPSLPLEVLEVAGDSGTRPLDSIDLARPPSGP